MSRDIRAIHEGPRAGRENHAGGCRARHTSELRRGRRIRVEEAGGSKTGWVGKILEPGVNNSDDSDDDDSDDDAPGMTPEDLGMTEGGGKGRAKASHHVTWLIASTSTEAQVSLFSSP